MQVSLVCLFDVDLTKGALGLLSSRKVKNRYQLKERLGTGGMGIVYRARDTVINADIALKTLADTADPVALRMFREECDKLAKIVHPNVVEIRDVGEIEEGGTRKPYLVMPFLRGRTLDSLIRDSSGPLPLERAIEILFRPPEDSRPLMKPVLFTETSSPATSSFLKTIPLS
jgi:hypothetical protein